MPIVYLNKRNNSIAHLTKETIPSPCSNILHMTQIYPFTLCKNRTRTRPACCTWLVRLCKFPSIYAYRIFPLPGFDLSLLCSVL